MTAGSGGDNRDFVCAISLGCRGKPDDTRHRYGACGGDIPGVAAFGNQAGRKQAGGDDSGKAEKLAGRSDNGDHSFGGSESGCEPSIVIASFQAIRCPTRKGNIAALMLAGGWPMPRCCALTRAGTEHFCGNSVNQDLMPVGAILRGC